MANNDGDCITVLLIFGLLIFIAISSYIKDESTSLENFKTF